MNTPKLCINCKYYEFIKSRSVGIPFFGRFTIPECHSCRLIVSPVDGTVIPCTCESIRGIGGRCRPDGIYFSPKDDVSPGVGNEVPK